MADKTFYKSDYLSPLGTVTLACDGENLVGLWLAGQKYFGDTVNVEMLENPGIALFDKAKEWLDRYFRGEKPGIGELPLSPADIARKIACKRGMPNMSAQAVGGAVGHNPISIIIPCHRVVGQNGSLTGYSGGIKTKIKLLEHENVDTAGFFIPRKSTAP